jgi:hypothetical protein
VNGVQFRLGAAALFLLGSAAAMAAEPPVVDASAEPPDDGSFLARFQPAVIEGPGLRLPEPVTRFYLDASYARSPDLSALPFIAGSGRNVRFAAGGTLRWRRVAFDAEMPFSQVTTLDITQVPGGVPIPQDRHETATSLGDLHLGVTWTAPLPVRRHRLVAGVGFRLRAPTHTTVFQFHLADLSLGQYRFPYYFHIEPTLILGGSIGPIAFVVNQGFLLLTGPDGDFQQVHIVVPNLLFWSFHYAVVYAPFSWLALSADLATDVQTNHVSEVDFVQLNGILAATAIAGLQVHIGRMRLDVVARHGLTRGATLFGVLQYAGTDSAMLRLGWRFD